VRVAVVGAGGMGSVFGGRLAANGHAVWLVHRRPEVVEALRRDGLRLDTAGQSERIEVQATTQPAEIGAVDLLLVLTKAFDTLDAAESARPLIGPETIVLTLQNGLGNDSVLGEVLGDERVVVGMSYSGAAMLGPGHVAHTHNGQTFVGERGGSLSERTINLARLFSQAGLPTEPTDQLWSLVWGKLVVNAALNATCALIVGSGSDVLRSDSAREWVGLVAVETAAVASAMGISLPFPDAAERVWQHCRDIRESKPSMLQDVLRGRPTEIDAINGAVVRAGARIGVATPYNQALLLLVSGREDVARAE
jgi:2-dehydropantoate 2-reductase